MTLFPIRLLQWSDHCLMLFTQFLSFSVPHIATYSQCNSIQLKNVSQTIFDRYICSTKPLARRSLGSIMSGIRSFDLNSVLITIPDSQHTAISITLDINFCAWFAL